MPRLIEYQPDIAISHVDIMTLPTARLMILTKKEVSNRIMDIGMNFFIIRCQRSHYFFGIHQKLVQINKNFVSQTVSKRSSFLWF